MQDNKNRGLFQKYIVTRIDGRVDPGADYFVLRLDKGDRHALAALTAYADSCALDYPDLAHDLRSKVAAAREGGALP